MVEDMGDFGTGTTPPPPPSEQPSPARSRSKARGAAAGIGVALVVGAGGIAVATSGSPSTTTPGAPSPSEGAPPTTAPGNHPGFPGGRGGGGFGGGMGGGLSGLAGIGGGGVLHGTFVVAKSGGGYQTIQEQTGTVESVSSTALSVKSKDGFTFTYVVKAGTNVDAQRDGVTSIKKGDEVVVSATLSGTTGTVDRVLDSTDLKSLPQGGFGGGTTGHVRGPRSQQSAPANPGTGT